MNGNPTGEEPWSEEELIDLGQLYSIGIPIEHVAKFLGRNLAEVQRQARLLNITPAPLHWDNHGPRDRHHGPSEG